MGELLSGVRRRPTSLVTAATIGLTQAPGAYDTASLAHDRSRGRRYYVLYYDGIYNPALPANNAYREYAESTGMFTQRGPQGPDSVIEIGPVAMTTEQLALTAAWDAAAEQAATLTANQATIQANIKSRMATISAWIEANPNGAVLTAAQTLVLAKMLYGIGLVLNQEFSSTAGT